MPLNSDVAQVANGKVTLDAALTFGALDFSGGIIDGSSNLTLLGTAAGNSQWTGGEITSATLTFNSGTTTTIGSGTTAKKINSGGKLNLGGTTNWTADAILAGGATTTLTNTGAFNTTFDGVITNDTTATGGRASFKNDGTFTKSNGGGGATEVQTVFDNSSTGAVSVQTGTLRLTGGGTSTGSVNVSNGASLQLKDNNYSFSGGALGGTGTIEVNSSTTSFSGTTGTANLSVTGGTAKFNGNHSTTGALTLSSGTIDGVAAATATVGGFNWSTGDITTTKVNSNGAATISGAGSKRLIGGAQLTLTNATTWDGSSITTSGAAAINNQSTGTFSAGDGLLSSDGTVTFTNAGAFKKSSGTGETHIQTIFDSSGSITVDDNKGTLRLSGGGKSTGAVSVGTGATLRTTNNYTFEAGALSGAGTIDVNGGTSTFKNTTGSANLSVSGGTANIDTSHATSGKLSLSSGGVSGTGAATVGSLDWTGGNLNAKVTSAGGTIGGGGTKTLGAGGDLTLTGNTTWDGSTLATSGSAKIKNEATGTFTTGDGLLSSDGTTVFTNAGTFKKSNGGGTTNVASQFDSSGTIGVDDNRGTLKLSGGGKASGNVSVGTDAKLEIASNYTFENTTHSGAGTIELSAATTTFKGANGAGKVSLNGGNATFDTSASTAANLSLSSGTVASSNGGSADVSSLSWTGGTITGKVKAGGGSFNGGGNKIISGGDLTLSGNTAWDGSTLATSNSAKIKNEVGAIFTTTDGSLTSDGTVTFTNAGTLKKANGGGTTDILTRLDSSGSIAVDDNRGTLKLSGGGKSTGGISVGTGARLQIATADYAFEGGALTGAGTIELNGATTTFKGTTGSAHLAVNGGTAKFETTHQSSGKFTLLSGGVTGAGSATFGSFDWTGGSVNASITSNGGTIGGGGSKSLSNGGKLTFNGNTAWDGSTITTGGGAVIENGAAFSANDGTIAHDGTTRATFKNTGSFIKANGNGTTDVQTRFDNFGTVQVDSGKLRLSGGGNGRANSGILVAAGAQLEVEGDLTLDSTSELKGKGLARHLNGVLTAEGTLAIENFELLGGQLRGTHTFAGTVNWHGGDWNATAPGASTTIAAGAILNIGNAANHDFNFRSIANEGTVNWNSGDLRGGNGSVFTNNNVFFDLNTGAVGLSTGGVYAGSLAYTNNGTYHKLASGTTTFSATFTNNGGLNLTSGAVVFAGAFINNGQIHLANGASAQFSNALVFGASSPLSGTGTIMAPAVTAAGVVAPGSSPGLLSITGDFSLLATSSLLIELGGTGQGTTYDFVSIGGNAIVAGSLTVSFVNGFQGAVQSTDTFTVLTAGGPAGVTGLFANVANGGRIAVSGTVGSFQVNYGPTSAFGTSSLVLSNFSSVPEPSTYALLGVGATMLFSTLRRRRA